MIHGRLLLGLDPSDAGVAAVDFTIGMAGALRSEVVVAHVREIPPSLRVPPLLSTADARALVESAVVRLREAGVPATGIVCAAREDAVARTLVDLSVEQACEAVVLGSRRATGLHRLAGGRVRERLVRTSHLPVVVAPPGLRCSTRRLASELSATTRH